MAATACQIVRLRRTHAVLHLHSSFGWSFFEKALLAWLGRACGYRVIVHIHGSSFDDFARRSPLRSFVRRSLEAADVVVALSGYWSSFLRELAPGASVVTIENGVSVPDAPPGGTEECRVILLLGILSDRKGVPEAIQAFARIADRHPQASLVLAGPAAPADEARYRALAASAGVQHRVVFAGSVRGEAKSRLIEGCGAFILPSHAEGLPIALLEAEPVTWHPHLIGALAWSVLALTLGGSSLLYMLIQRGAATEVTSLLYLVPPCTAAMAWVLFDEPLGAATLAGMALTAIGVALVVRPARPTRR
jgi:glycosyltransferase involved in cell wall biosynthesis